MSTTTQSTAKPYPTRVVIIEDQTAFREMLAELLRLEGYSILKQLGRGQVALSAIDELRPDMVIVDVVLPDMSGLDVVRHILKRHPRTHTMVITAHGTPRLIMEAFHTKAHGIVSKDASLHDLREGLSRVALGQTYYCPKTSTLLRQAPETAPDNDNLSRRERQIVQMVAQGQSTKDIASYLDLSPKTVANHRHRIAKKLGINDVASFTRYAVARGWIVENA